MGRANYWTGLPFCGLLILVAIFGLIWPEKVPAPPGRRRWPPLAVRLWFGLVLALVVGIMVPAMLREARNDPDCNHPGTAMGQVHRWPDHGRPLARSTGIAWR